MIWSVRIKRGRSDLTRWNCMREKDKQGVMVFPFREEKKDYVD